MKKILESITLFLNELMKALWNVLQIILWAVVPAFVLYMLVQSIVLLMEKLTS